MGSVTEPLRAEHRDLLPHLARLDRTASELAGLTAGEINYELEAVLDFLQGHLVPHALAEEHVLYPAVEEAMGAPGGTLTMVADHREIVERIERLASRAANVTAVWPATDVVDDVTNQLAGLAAIIGMHFRKEEEVLLPFLDRTLTEESARALFERMGHHEHV